MDVLVALAFAAAFTAGGLRLKNRKAAPVRRRIMDSGLSAILFFVLGVRCAIYAVCVLVMPQAVLGADPASMLPLVLFVVYAVAGAVGIGLYRGPVSARIAASAVLSALLAFEAILAFAVLPSSTLMRVDTAIGVLLAIAAVLLAMFHWSHRTATPNPLGGLGQPLDY